jgi:hypothetical protein
MDYHAIYICTHAEVSVDWKRVIIFLSQFELYILKI